MLTERIRGESGYSLVEVMASIIILSIAIIPMVGMFDMGLQNATRGSNYDKSRALANLKLEEAKNLPFADAENNFPEAGTAYNAGNYLSDWMEDTGEPYWDDTYANLHYRIEKQYMQKPTVDSVEWVEETSGTPTELIRVTVEVGWGDYNPLTDSYSNTYTTVGLVSA